MTTKRQPETMKQFPLIFGVKIFHIFQPNNAMINSVKGGGEVSGQKNTTQQLSIKETKTL